MYRSFSSRILVLSAVLLALGACSDLNTTEQRMMTGGAVGAVAGTVGTVLLGGCIPCGTAIGGAVGAGSGYLVDKVKDSQEP